MDYFLEFGGRDDVQELVRRYLERPEAVQGVTVDLDDFWLASWQLYTTSPRDYELAQRRLFELWSFYGGRRPWTSTTFVEFARPFSGPYLGYPFGIDASWRPSAWVEYTSMRGLPDEPFVLNVILMPDVIDGSFGALQEINTEGFQVRFESRPIATLYAHSTDALRPLMGGVSVSRPAGPPGTLGGVVQDASGRRFGLTSAHLLSTGDEAQQPSPYDNSYAASRIGTCTTSTPLTSHTPPIDPYDPSINEVDVAAIELDEPSDLAILGVGGLSGIASKSRVNTDASVEVAGKSGRRSLYIGGVTLGHTFNFDGDKYGYKNLFELKRQSRFWGVTGTLTPPVRPGDSGGWVLIEGANGTDWLGVIVAGDGPVGYAIPAEFVTDWLAASAEITAPVSVS